MRVIECRQLTPEWWEARRGVPTASQFGRILTPKTLKPSAQADAYIDELIGDLVSLNPPVFSQNGYTAAMTAGREFEPEARRFYEMERGVDVREVGFVMDDLGRFGCSPDGLVGDDGGLELKCPLPKTHAGYLREGGLPVEYAPQVHGSLVVTGRAWWDFLSYAPGLPEVLVRVTPNEYTEALREALEVFWARYMEAMDKFKANRRQPTG